MHEALHPKNCVKRKEDGWEHVSINNWEETAVKELEDYSHKSKERLILPNRINRKT